MSTKTTGDQGEDLAAEYLEGLGYTVLERNYRFERAEVDIVCYRPAKNPAKGGQIIFVEVKARKGLGYGRPEEAVTEAKQRQIRHAARAYLYETGLEGAPARFDVVSVLLRDRAAPEIEHFEDAFA